MRTTNFAGHGVSRLGLAWLLVAALAGCSTAPRETRAGYEAVADGSGLPGDSRAPMAELPAAAGAVVAVVEAQSRGVLTQRIVLRGDPGTVGENAIVVKVDQSKGPSISASSVCPTRR